MAYHSAIMEQEVESIQIQVKRVQEWFEVELSGGLRTVDSEKIKIAICREIQRSLTENEHRVKVALLTLALGGFVKNPLKFTEDDISNALWLIRDLRLGFDEQAPISWQ